MASLVVSGCTADDGQPPPVGSSSATAGLRSSSAPAEALDDLGDLVVGEPTSVVWWKRGRLHAWGRDWPMTAPSGIYQAGETVLVEHVRHRRTRLVQWTERGGRPLFEGSLHGLALATDGTLAVWMYPLGDKRRRLTAWDLTADSEMGSTVVKVETSCCTGDGEVYLQGITNDDRLMYSVDDDAFAWTPGQDPVALTMPKRAGFYSPWPQGLMFQGRSDSLNTPGVFGTVSSIGIFHRVGTTKSDQLGAWSPDGARFVYLANASGSVGKLDNDHVWVQDVDGGADRSMILPPGRNWGLVAWESSEVLVLQAPGVHELGEPEGLTSLVRCDVRTLACERPRGAPTGFVVLPEPL